MTTNIDHDQFCTLAVFSDGVILKDAHGEERSFPDDPKRSFSWTWVFIYGRPIKRILASLI